MKIRGFTCDPTAFSIAVSALENEVVKSTMPTGVVLFRGQYLQSFLNSLLQAIEDSAE